MTSSNFPLIVSLLFSPLDCPLSRFALLPLAPLPRTARDAAHTRAPHYQALGSRALHTWLATLTRSVRSYLLQGTVSRGPQAAAARSAHGLCSLVSRAHDSSQRRTERPTADRTLSAKKRVCFLSPSFLRLFSFLSFYLFFSFKFSPCALLSLFSPPPSFTYYCHHRRRVCVHEIRRRDFSFTPASFLPSVEFPPREPRASSFSVVCLHAARPFWDFGVPTAAGPPQVGLHLPRGPQTSREKCNARSCLGIPVTTRCRDENG